MHILDTKVMNLTRLEGVGGFSARLQLLTDVGGVVVDTFATLHREATHSEIFRALLDDAIRQLHRMPEVRTGRRPVTVAEDALDSQLDET